jgi:hypothetical protein
MERIARTGLWAVLAFAVVAWIARRFLDADNAALLSTVVVLLLLVAVPLGIFVARHPREIPRTGDRLFDEEIDRVLRQRSEKSKKNP